jgi:signal transduction histidine kinase
MQITVRRGDHRFPVLLSGAVAALIGLVVVVSWHAQFEALIQLQADFPAMAYRSAIGLGVSGLALLLLGLGMAGAARLTAAIVAGASLLQAVAELASVNIGIDRLLRDPYILPNSTTTNTIAPQTAIGLLATCLAIILASHPRPVRGRSFILAIAGSLVVALSVVALAGYLTGFEQAAGWGRYAKMSSQTAAGFLALGSGVVALGWGEARRASRTTPRWLFAPIAIGVATVSILFSQALFSYEDRQIELAVQTELAAVRQEVESELASSVGVVERTARRWESGGRPEQVRWQHSMGLNFDGTALYQAIDWVDPSYTAQWVVPPSANARDIGIDFGAEPALRPVLDAARQTRQTMLSRPIDRGRGDLEIFIVSPIYLDISGEFDGFIVGVMHVNDALGIVLNQHVSATSSIAIYDGTQRIFERSDGDDDEAMSWSADIPANVRNAEWTLRVWPSNIAPYRSILPYGALVSGFVVAVLLGLVTWLLQQSGERERAVQRANVTLQAEIAERQRAEEELRLSTGALERSNRSLQEFAYVASHDLKAPLVSLQGLATMLKEDAGETLTGDASLYLDRIVANATKMRNLLDDLLELARVGREDVPVSAVDLGEVIDGVTGQLHQILKQRDAEVIVAEPLPTVAANPVRLHQVFANLIDNALKYTPTERTPRIEIGATEAGNTWRVFVRDNGTGIPPEHRDKIFTMFQRLPKGRAMNPTGTGMGLAIISRIVEGNGGRCWIADSDDGGTTFFLTFPKPEPDHLNHISRAPKAAGVA